MSVDKKPITPFLSTNQVLDTKISGMLDWRDPKNIVVHKPPAPTVSNAVPAQQTLPRVTVA